MRAVISAQRCDGLRRLIGARRLAGGLTLVVVAASVSVSQYRPSAQDHAAPAVRTVAAEAPQAATPVTLPSAAAHWTLDDGSGTAAADSSGNGYTATLGSGGSWVAGQVGAHAVAVDGTSNGVITVPQPVIDTSRSFTVSAWVKFSQVGGYQTVFGIDGANIGGFFLQLSGSTGSFAMTRRSADSTSSTEVRADSSVAPVAGHWYHIVGEDDVTTNTLKIFVDGVEGTDGAFTSPWRATGATTIGRGDYGGPVDFVHGSVDDVEVFQSALSAGQVIALAQDAHWSYDEGSGQQATDDSGHGNGQTLASGAGWTTGRVGTNALTVTGAPDSYAAASGPVVDTRYSFSVAAWVKFNSLGGYQDVAAVDGNSVSGFYLQLRGDTGKLGFTRLSADSTGGATAAASSTTVPKAGTWYHVVGVDDVAAGQLQLYVNGVAQGTTSYSGNWQASGAFTVGRGLYNGGPTDFLNGTIDDVQVFDHALSASEVQNLVGSAGGALDIDAGTPLHALPSSFFGLMTEDINHSMTGGLYAELINNRSMMASTSSPVDWDAVGDATLALDPGNPLNSALTRSLRIEIGKVSANAPAGVANRGYWGIPVTPDQTYNVNFFAKATAGFHGPLTVAIQSSDGATTYASAHVGGVGTDWAQLQAVLHTGPHAPTTADARFVFTTDGNSEQSLWLDNVSLFPPTYDSQPNGLRPDLMTDLAKLNPAFIRLPGGNYLEGNTIGTRFDWKATIGPVWTRPGHTDDAWGYWSTDGMGLLEYLEWCEDLGAQPMLAVYAGYALDSQVVPQDQLGPYVQDALDEIQYATGSTDTKWGAERAKDGHPAPFKVDYVEVGNEDFFDRSGSYNSYRFPMFYDAIKNAYPSIKVIATTGITSRTPDVVDQHYYQSPAWMNANANLFDSASRSGPKIMVGEWASQEGRPTPDLNAAIGDASWLTGLERNSDVVTQEAYAPMLVNVNNVNWGTNLIGFDALTSYVSPSYYVQEMMANGHGNQVLKVSYSGVGGINTVATTDSNTGDIYVTIVNPGPAAQPVTVNLSGAAHINATGTQVQLTSASPSDTNTITDPGKVAPVTQEITGLGTMFTERVPGYSVTVVTLHQR